MVDKTCEGVCMQASTWGSLEALLAFFISSKMSIPVRDKHRVNVSNIGLLTVASNFQDDMSRKDWNLVKVLKKIFKIP
ncbi:hypothetical protein WN943_021392 [Citrus x changshan-huyou]